MPIFSLDGLWRNYRNTAQRVVTTRISPNSSTNACGGADAPLGVEDLRNAKHSSRTLAGLCEALAVNPMFSSINHDKILTIDDESTKAEPTHPEPNELSPKPKDDWGEYCGGGQSWLQADEGLAE